MSRANDIDPKFYAMAEAELEGDRQRALWTKQMALYDGDEAKARYGYIRARSIELAQTRLPPPLPLRSIKTIPTNTPVSTTPVSVNVVSANGEEETSGGRFWMVFVLGGLLLWALRFYLAVQLGMPVGAELVGYTFVGLAEAGRFTGIILVTHIVWFVLLVGTAWKATGLAPKIVSAITCLMLLFSVLGTYGNSLP